MKANTSVYFGFKISADPLAFANLISHFSHSVVLLANRILKDAGQRREYTAVYRSLRRPLDQDPFDARGLNIRSAFAAPESSPDPNGPNGRSSNTDKHAHATQDDGYAEDGTRGARARWSTRNPAHGVHQAEAEQVFHRAGFTLFVRPSCIYEFLISCNYALCSLTLSFPVFHFENTWKTR